MLQIFFPLLCHYSTKIQCFNIDKWSSDALEEHWLLTVQSWAKDFKFPLLVFEVWTWRCFSRGQNHADPIYIPSSPDGRKLLTMVNPMLELLLGLQGVSLCEFTDTCRLFPYGVDFRIVQNTNSRDASTSKAVIPLCKLKIHVSTGESKETQDWEPPVTGQKDSRWIAPKSPHQSAPEAGIAPLLLRPPLPQFTRIMGLKAPNIKFSWTFRNFNLCP